MNLEQLANRLYALERANTRLRIVLFVLLTSVPLLLLLPGLAASPPPPDTHDELRAKRFTLMDDKGNCRATLGLAPGVMVHMVSQPGYERAFFSLNAADERSRLELSVTHDGQPMLRLQNEDQKSPLNAWLDRDGRPSLSMFDGKGNNRIRLGFQSNGEPDLTIKDESGKDVFKAPTE